jgi:hypothetical protein
MIPFLASLVLRRQWGSDPGAPANLISFCNQFQVQQRGLPRDYIGRCHPNWAREMAILANRERPLSISR